MTTLVEHAARIEAMKKVEKRVRDSLKDGLEYGYKPQFEFDDIRLLLERIDNYEASITWDTNCLTCPKLYDQIYEMDQHTIPELRAEILKLRELLRHVLDDARISGADQVSDRTKGKIREALVVKP